MSSKHTSCYVTFIWCGCSRMPYPLQVLIWWGDFPCSRAKMSRRSVTLEELSSSAWARLRSYDPASKSAVHLFHLFHLFLRASADKPVHEHAAWRFRSLKMFYWERISEVLQVFQLSRGLCGRALCFHVISEQRGWQRNWKPSALRPLNSHSTCQRSAVCLKKKEKEKKKKQNLGDLYVVGQAVIAFPEIPIHFPHHQPWLVNWAVTACWFPTCNRMYLL